MDTAEFAGRVAVVTGAARGIGATTARMLAEHGALVAALDRDTETLTGSGHPGVRPFPCDVTDATEVDSVIAMAAGELGPIDMLVNVAGVLATGPVVDIDDDEWAATFAVNTTGVFTVSRAVARLMIPRGNGAIVTVGSNAAATPRAGMAAYAASKAAAAMATKCLGLEVARYGIRCNVVSPGSTDTDMQRSMWTDDSGAADVIRGSLDQYKVGIPLGRIADPSDVADAVLFLLSDRARHITMHDLCVDGGATPRS